MKLKFVHVREGNSLGLALYSYTRGTSIVMSVSN